MDSTKLALIRVFLGDVVWSPGAREEELAAVVAEEPSKTMRLTPASRRSLEANRPELALKLYCHIAAESFPNRDGGLAVAAASR